MKSGNLNFLEPSGTLQACNGTALPLKREEGTGLKRKLYDDDLLTKHHGHQIKKFEMSGEWSKYGGGGRREMCAGFRWRNLQEKDKLEDLGIDWRIILKWILKQ